MKKLSDKEFAEWCTVRKPCRYCGDKFVGPVCPCELPFGAAKKDR